MATRTFEEASKSIQAALQKHLERFPYDESLSDESEEEEAADDQVCSQLLDRVFQSYEREKKSVPGLGRSNASIPDERTRHALISSIKHEAGHNSCLICISNLKKSDPIWSCVSCFCSFHLVCIQRWSKDNIFQQRTQFEQENAHSSSLVHKTSFNWACPKCRQTYGEQQVPVKYLCYCGKSQDPSFDPWIIPHSCGNACEKSLKPECGHRCLILCHPGPCPPCPKMLLADCFCTQSAPASRRCFDKAWSCSKPCGRRLNCGQHTCPQPCHAGDCAPCGKKSVQLCLCQRSKKQCDCASPQWQCSEKCGRPLECGHHMCDVVCHQGPCLPCPLSLTRSCPCGKSKFQLPCTEATPTCGDTCGRVLSCGLHSCAERCHRGSCGPCQQVLNKQCRCGAKKKDVICWKDFTCETKCRNLRDCTKHTCNRKCCDGETCPPCEQQCNKSLACKNHKCSSRCHPGACYPCTLSREVSCFCGSTRMLVPCGMERSTKPPKCKAKCQKPSLCHHPPRHDHLCHSGDCPPCRQVCGKVLRCSHQCTKPCHDRVAIKLQAKASTPCEISSPSIEIRSVDCPPCDWPVTLTCLGGHETYDAPCHSAVAASCQRPCGRELMCGNHKCSRLCHKVKHAASKTLCGTNCRPCEQECSRPRPEGCQHPCPKPCHSDPCDPCRQIIRIRCLCGMAQLYVTCEEWVLADEKSRDALACCKDQCPKSLQCGHRCFLSCHRGQCGRPEMCRKKVKMYCPCKRIKQEVVCGQQKGKELDCDDDCLALKAKAHRLEEEEQVKRRLEVERLQREEAERFAKKLDSKRRRRPRRTVSESTDTTFGFTSKIIAAVLLLSAIVAACAAFYWSE